MTSASWSSRSSRGRASRACREQRGDAACREQDTDDAEPEGETTPAVREHAGHGSRAPRRPRPGFTERFHPAECGIPPRCPAWHARLRPTPFLPATAIPSTSGAAAWARSSARPTRSSAATSRSRCSPSATRRTTALRQRFKREALAAARLSGNPNIVTIFDVDEHNGRPLIVMEYLAGGSLEERAAAAPCPPAQVLDWLDDAAAALDAAHEAGVVHRDVKPGNLILDARGNVQVADFGIASASGMESFTQAGTILGTAGYLSPEQARGERAGPASDRYALAVVAWELLAGRRPFEADVADGRGGRARDRARSRRCTPRTPTVPRRVRRGLRARAREGSGRALSDGGGVRRRAARRAARATPATRGSSGHPPPTAATRASHAAAPASRWWIPALVVLLLAAGILAAVLLGRGGDNKTSAHPRAARRRSSRRSRAGHDRAPDRRRPSPAARRRDDDAVPDDPRRAARAASALNDAGYSEDAGGRRRGCAAAARAGGCEAVRHGQHSPRRTPTTTSRTRATRLGNCTDVLTLLDRSESIQGHRKEIDRLRKSAEKRC